MLRRSGNEHGSICTLPTSLNKPGDHGLSSGGALSPAIPGDTEQSGSLALGCPRAPGAAAGGQLSQLGGAQVWLRTLLIPKTLGLPKV